MKALWEENIFILNKKRHFAVGVAQEGGLLARHCALGPVGGHAVHHQQGVVVLAEALVCAHIVEIRWKSVATVIVSHRPGARNRCSGQ